MEGTEPCGHGIHVETPCKTLLHLRGGLVRKGERQELPRVDPALLGQPRQALNDDTCLACTRAREDERDGPSGAVTASRCCGFMVGIGSSCGCSGGF